MSPWGRWIWIGIGLWLLCSNQVNAGGIRGITPSPRIFKVDKLREITKGNLKQILKEHELWEETSGKQGKRANLSKVNLTGANLRGANLSRADLSDAKLSGADLSKATLSEANMSGVDLFEANLSDTLLSAANLSEADLTKVKLRKQFLRSVNLSGALLRWADLSGSDMRFADLRGSMLFETNLSNTDLLDADLSEAHLSLTDLRGADLESVDLSRAIFEPKPGWLPEVSGLIGIRGLDSLRFTGASSYAVVELREIYKKGGMREEERQVTFALNHNRRINAWEEIREAEKEAQQKGERIGWISREIGRLENYFRLAFFEWTCDYGMTPGRPLRIILLGIFLFIFPYFLALRSRKPKTGIWRLLPADRVLDRKTKDAPVKLRAKGWKDIRAWGLAFYFSILSAFHIGWRDLNVGSWIARLQRREYNLRATGWVRTVSGFQSLLSVYMLALWALSYFGRPFE